MLIHKIRKIGFWEYLVYTVGLSIAFLMFAGLAINWLLPWLHITDKPLSLTPLLICFNTILVIFGVIAYRRNKDISIKIKLPKLDWLNKIFFITPLFFPILSILGAITLNNGGYNYLTMSMLGGIAIYIFFCVFLKKRLNGNIHPWSIFLISLSLLLMFSLRSWHILGWDVSQEYEMFKITQQNSHWSMSYFPGQPYYACLSITILPIVINSFMNINDEYIFKLIFQILFSFAPIMVYLFTKRYTINIVAFLASFFFIAQPQFIQSMPSVVRQEVALLFCFLSLLILFDEKLNSQKRKLLFILFSCSIVISHYTTTYVTTLLFVLTYILCYLYKIYKNRNITSPKYSLKLNYYFSWKLILPFLLFAFLWLNQITKVTGSLTDVAYSALSNINRTFNEDVRIGHTFILNQFNVFYRSYNQQALLNKYYSTLLISNNTKDNNNNLYPPLSYRNYVPEALPPEELPSRINPKMTQTLNILLRIVEILLKLILLLGVFFITFRKFDKKRPNIEVLMLILLSLLIVGLMTILPVVSLHYPIERLYQQSLFYLSLPVVLGCLYLMKVLKKEKLAIYFTLTIFVIHFMYISGFISQISGISEPTMPLNRNGDIYNQIYAHDSELKSINWLVAVNNSKQNIYADRYGYWKIQAFALTKEDLKTVFPPIIEKNAYVYSTYTNTTKRRAFIETVGADIAYAFPIHFISDNKNKIYSNGNSEVFK